MKDQINFSYLSLIALSIVIIIFDNQYNYEFISYLRIYEIPNIIKYGKIIL